MVGDKDEVVGINRIQADLTRFQVRGILVHAKLELIEGDNLAALEEESLIAERIEIFPDVLDRTTFMPFLNLDHDRRPVALNERSRAIKDRGLVPLGVDFQNADRLNVERIKAAARDRVTVDLYVVQVIVRLDGGQGIGLDPVYNRYPEGNFGVTIRKRAGVHLDIGQSLGHGSLLGGGGNPGIGFESDAALSQLSQGNRVDAIVGPNIDRQLPGIRKKSQDMKLGVSTNLSPSCPNR